MSSINQPTNENDGATHKQLKGRINYIDGLRGVAILVVILFHAFARHPKLYVYGDRFVGSIFDTKTAGVNLFFIISGFVILMTLRKCNNFTEFISRRWHRLFPAMLICSLFVLFTVNLFPERPRGDINFWDLLPGLTFIGDVSYITGSIKLFAIYPTAYRTCFPEKYLSTM